MSDSVTDPRVRKRISEIQEKLTRSLERADPHHRLVGRPLAYKVVSGQTLEITFQEVPRIDESELMEIKRSLGESCYARVLPETERSLLVRFVVPLTEPESAHRPVG